MGGYRDDTVHEASYLPFIYSTDDSAASSSVGSADERPLWRGRRTFNTKGQEVVAPEVSAEEIYICRTSDQPRSKRKTKEEGEEETLPSTSTVDEKSRFKRPISISGFRATPSARSDGKKTRTKTAQMLIREDISVRPPAPIGSAVDTNSIPRNAGFIKPEGVDVPTPPLPKKASKRDRESELNADPSISEGKKRKKKKEGKS